jgi:SIR2-like domain
VGGFSVDLKETEPSYGPTEACVENNSAELFARRGTKWMNNDDLQAHLAALLRLENVGVLLGAGASMERGLSGMTMSKLWEYFVSSFDSSYTWLIDEKFIAPDAGTPNVEELIDTLEIARSEWFRQHKTRSLVKLDSARADLQRAVIRASLLNEGWWKDPTSVDNEESALGSHRMLLYKLVSARQPGQPSPWVFTTNYDLAVEWAGESIGLKVSNGFDGLHNRTFAPHNFDLGYRNTLARGEARFGTYNIYLVKLHGSLTWQLTKDGTSYVEHSAEHLWGLIDAFLKGDRADGFPGPMVFPSAAKYTQTVGFVLGELLRRFTDVLARPQTCLITCGYSFSDEHLNRIIASALQNPTLQLVIYLPEAMRHCDKLDVSACRPWLRRIANLASPQVTIVGGGDTAFFNAFVSHLPDPVIYDEQAARIREMLQKRHEDASPATDSRGSL